MRNQGFPNWLRNSANRILLVWPLGIIIVSQVNSHIGWPVNWSFSNPCESTERQTAVYHEGLPGEGLWRSRRKGVRALWCFEAFPWVLMFWLAMFKCQGQWDDYSKHWLEKSLQPSPPSLSRSGAALNCTAAGVPASRKLKTFSWELCVIHLLPITFLRRMVSTALWGVFSNTAIIFAAALYWCKSMAEQTIV